MAKTGPPYPAEFREQIIELSQAGRSPAELSREFGPTIQTILNWLATATRDAGKPLPGKEGLTTAEREEMVRLRPGNGENGKSIKKALETHDGYNEDSIQIFRMDLDPRFDWRLAEEWARKYQRDAKFILRGIMACRECCVSPTWFLNRYLERNQNAPRREDVEAAHRRLLTEAQANRK